MKSCLHRNMLILSYILILVANSQNYILIEEALSFDDAESLCLFRYDTHLASIHNDIDFTDAKNVMSSSLGTVWIGLRYDFTTGWAWTDDTDWDYGIDIDGDDGNGPWKNGEPNDINDHCVRIYNASNYEWSDTHCDDKYFPLCAYPKPLKLKTDYVRAPTAVSRIGVVDILDDIYIEFDIIFKSFPPNGSGSILHFGNNDDEQYPAIIIDTATNSLETIVSKIPTHNFNFANIALNSSYHYTFHLTQNYLQITLHSDSVPIIRYNQTVSSHSILMQRDIYINNPWNSDLDQVFEREITNLSVSTSNQYDTDTSNEFNYICDESRWVEEYRVNWDFLKTDTKCTITQTNYDYNYNRYWYTWIGGLDASSNDWTDYKVETKFIINNINVQQNSEPRIVLYLRPHKILFFYGYFIDALDYTQDIEHTLRVEVKDDVVDIYWNNEFNRTWIFSNVYPNGSVGFATNGAAVTFTSLRVTFEVNGELFTAAPTTVPTNNPTLSTTNPTVTPTNIPSYIPTNNPITSPPTTSSPTYTPTPSPTNITTTIPTNYPSNIPTNIPTNNTTALTEKTTASDQDGQVQNSISTTTRYLITESPQVSFVNTTLFIQITIITSCLCIIFCICIGLREKYKRNKLKKAFSTKTLTEIDLGNVKVMHYVDTPGGMVDFSGCALPGETPGIMTPGIMTPGIMTPGLEMTEMTTPGFSTHIQTPPLPVHISCSSISLSNSTEHEFEDNVSNFAVTTDVLLEDVVENAETKGNEEGEEEEKDGMEEEVKDDGQDLYHEKQKWEMCLLHALNSLLQREEFNNKSLDNICKMLAPNKMINPHKSILQTGNYDANVLMMALGNINVDVQWFDARKAKELDVDNELFLEPDKSVEFVGFILNNPQKAIFGIFSRRHWLAIKKINGCFYNLDSKLPAPKPYKNNDELTQFLVGVLTANNAELMICRRKKKKAKKQEVHLE